MLRRKRLATAAVVAALLFTAAVAVFLLNALVLGRRRLHGLEVHYGLLRKENEALTTRP